MANVTTHQVGNLMQLYCKYGGTPTKTVKGHQRASPRFNYSAWIESINIFNRKCHHQAVRTQVVGLMTLKVMFRTFLKQRQYSEFLTDYQLTSKANF